MQGSLQAGQRAKSSENNNKSNCSFQEIGPQDFPQCNMIPDHWMLYARDLEVSVSQLKSIPRNIHKALATGASTKLAKLFPVHVSMALLRGH